MPWVIILCLFASRTRPSHANARPLASFREGGYCALPLSNTQARFPNLDGSGSRRADLCIWGLYGFIDIQEACPATGLPLWQVESWAPGHARKGETTGPVESCDIRLAAS